VDGHARVEEALSRGEATVPVLYVELEPHEEDVVLATLDPIGALATRDDERLRMLLAEVEFDSEALREMTEALLPIDPKQGLTDPDDVPELTDDSGIKAGDLFALGDHRLMCGDSTKAEDVARLAVDGPADALFTSPPYLHQRDYNGNMADDWQKLMVEVFAAAPVTPEAQVFVNLGPVHREGRVIRYWDGWIDAMEASGWPLFGWYVWDKLNGMPGNWNGRLAPAHEFIFHFAADLQQPRKTIKTKGTTSRTSPHTQRRADGTMKAFYSTSKIGQPMKIPDSVVRLTPQQGGVEGHVAPFPVAFPLTFLQAYHADTWVDPFMGAGTTIIAAEQVGRRTYGMEIDPRYVAVAIKRWEQFTGRKAEKINGPSDQA
jgi:DNA modification methylase